MRVETIAVVGAGLMGRGIAYAAVAGGYRTVLQDVSPEALDRARSRSAPTWTRAARAVAGAGFVIEAVPEQIEWGSSPPGSTR